MNTLQEKRVLLFTERLRLQRAFQEWTQEARADDCPMNVVAWLQSLDMIDVDKAKGFLELRRREGK